MLAYQDLETGTEGIFEVIPITPKYRRDISSRSEGTPHQKQTFELNTQTGSFNIEYECGTLDFEAMTDAVAEENPGLLTHGGNFRRRYRPSQATQGVDIYANGRVLMTSVFSELFDLSRNNQYNYFGGTLRITPKHPEEVEVPTDNKKTRIDTNSELWRQLVEIFSTEEYQPVGKRYDNSASDSEVGSTDTESAQRGADREESSLGEPSSDLPGPEGAVSPIDGGKYGLIRADSRFLSDHLSYFDADRLKEDLVDVTVTSPPYADLKNYGYDTDAQVGFGDNYESYLSDLQNIFGQTYDITKPDGSLWIIINTFKKNGEITQLPADVARICQQLGGIPNCPNCSSSDLKVPLIPQATGRQYSCQNCSYTSTGDSDSWLLQDIIVWDKNRALPYSDNRFRNVFEYILCFSKQTDFHFDLDSVRVADPSKFKSWWVDYPERYHPKGMVPENIWSMTTPSQGSFGDGVLDHPAPFPPELVGQIINLTTSTGDVVFDPFAGSGTVLAQADAMDRRPLGFELSPDYCDDYNAVREYIAGRWNEETSTSHANQQEQLTEIIGGLRQVKQVRELLRKLATSQGASEAVQLDIEAAVHIAEGLNQDAIGTGAFIESSIIFVVDSGVTAQRAVALESAAAEHLSKKPLSSYGVNAKPFVMTATELHSAVSEGDLPKIQGQLFIYTNGRHYEFAETTTLESWLCNGSFNPSQQAQPSVQPILSNLGLDVTNPRRGSGETPTRTVHRLNKQSGGSVSYEHQVATQPNISTGD
jgi:DNA modification methylase